MTREQLQQLYLIKKINGKPIYEYIFPQGEKHELHTVDKDSGRLANGTMERQIIGHKNKFIITFPYMYKEQFDKVNNTFSHDMVTLEYEHFYTGNIVSGKFYVGGSKTKERKFIDVNAHQKTIMERLIVEIVEI